MRSIMAIILTLLAGSVYAAGARELTVQTAPQGIRSVTVSAKVGSITVDSATDAMISATVKLEPSEHGFWVIRWHNRKDVEAVEKARLTQRRDGDTLHLLLDMPVKADADGYKETWTLHLPPALAAKLRVKVGHINVSGIGGGVDLQANVGKIVVDVPGGAITAQTNVGKVDLKLGSAPGKVALRANVGSVHMTVDGKTIEPQHHNETGNDLGYSGSGNMPVDASVNVGNVRLDVAAGAVSRPAGNTLKKGDQAQPASDVGQGTR